jgi:hypothetical protein
MYLMYIIFSVSCEAKNTETSTAVDNISCTTSEDTTLTENPIDNVVLETLDGEHSLNIEQNSQCTF